MSFSLYALLEARKFKDLPKLLQEVITDDEERQEMFQDKFLDYDDKDRWACIRSAIDTCKGRGLFQERAFYHVLFLQEVRGETIDDEWEDMIANECEEHETQKVSYGTQTEPIAIQTEEPKQEVIIPMTTKPNEPRKRKVSQKYACATDLYHCSCCNLNLASDGSIHNHYKSRLHMKGIRKLLSLVRDKIVIGDKLIVKVRNASRDPDLSWEFTDDIEIEETFKAIEKYLDKEQTENPITNIYLFRAKRTVQSTGIERITWNSINIIN